MYVVYVSDGKAGHRSQALGLFQAMQRISGTGQLDEIHLEQLPFAQLFKGLFSHQVSQIKQTPDFIFGVGSHTHFRVWLLGKIYPQAKTIILMKPSLPIHWFNYAVVPKHDGIAESAHVIVTQGALSPIVNEHRHEANRILIALGGSSKRHQWNQENVITAIEQIIQRNPHADLVLTTSRRTPEHFLAHLKTQSFASRLNIFPVEETSQGWIFEQMQRAEAVWVTEDSVSMIFEALTAGCRVGVIGMNHLKQDRVTSEVKRLLDKKMISQQTNINCLPAPSHLNEAKRVANCLFNSASGQ